LDDANPLHRAIGSLNVMETAFEIHVGLIRNIVELKHPVETKKSLISWGDKVAKVLCSDEPYTTLLLHGL
jgi:hypothetical protein